ncbi:MAG TPA: CRTAC1 family protein [Acidimicrobiia bacterium]
MTGVRSLLLRIVTPATAVVIALVMFQVATLPSVSSAAERSAVERFHFTALSMPNDMTPGWRSVRTVNPSLGRIRSWISSVGAGVALADVDGDGLSNDLCMVDPRVDRVSVAPAPGTGARYPSFSLTPTGLRYDDTMAPMGCIPRDLNGDGWTDFFVYYWGRSPILFFRDPDRPLGADAFEARELVPSVPRWFTNAATLADLDGDGHVDIVVANYFPDGARVLDPRAHDSEQMQDSMSRAYNGGGKHFFLWQRPAASTASVPFREVPSGLSHNADHGWTLAVAARDLDGDLLPEVYLANDFGPDRLLYNESAPGHLRFRIVEGTQRFTTPKSKVLGRDSFKGMGVDFGDLNGDGKPDMVVSNITNPYALQESNFAFVAHGAMGQMRSGHAPYSDESEGLGLARSGWGWDVKLADFDNDGTPEVVQATGFLKGTVNRWPELQELAMSNDDVVRHPNLWPHFGPGDDLSGHQGVRFFVRVDGRYVDVAKALGLTIGTVDRGIAVADVYGNGNLDLAVANQWDQFAFYRNDCPRCGRSLELRLVRRNASGPTVVDQQVAAGAATTAFGATATVLLPDGRRLEDEVDGGNGHSGKRSEELHFGLGSDSRPLEVRVAWRDAQGVVHATVLSLSPGRHVVVLGDG